MTVIIGLMSGTSMDGIDAALVKITGLETDLSVELLKSQTYPYDPSLREEILHVSHGAERSIEAFAILDDRIALAFSQAALNIQLEHWPSGTHSAELIGSHGQTVFHRPPVDQTLGYTLQLGRGNQIAQRTGIPTVSNFRVADIAAGGQGAPLVPRVDVCLLSHESHSRCVQNIGGMGNTTYLPPRSQQQTLGLGVVGWDTGPGNILMDLAVAQLTQGELTYDKNGEWAAQGTPFDAVIQTWLQDPFFKLAPPKSTGREYFGQLFLSRCLQDLSSYSLSKADTLATLTDFTAQSIAQEYRRFLPTLPDEVLICGGGCRNQYLRSRLSKALDPIPVLLTDEMGVNAEAKEAIAFAVLAYWNRLNIPGNLPAVTGAKQHCVLGSFWPAL